MVKKSETRLEDNEQYKQRIQSKQSDKSSKESAPAAESVMNIIDRFLNSKFVGCLDQSANNDSVEDLNFHDYSILFE